MGLLALGNSRVGFWVVARGTSARDELPPHIQPLERGEPSDLLRSLVVAAADGAGQVQWAALLHGDGAAVLLPWRGRLWASMGPLAVLLDEHGTLQAEHRFETDITAAWPVEDEGLLLLGQQRAWLVDERLQPRWSRPLEGDRLAYLGFDGRALKLVSMTGDDWVERLLDVRTGASLGSA